MRDLPGKVGLSEPHLYKMLREGEFPPSFKLTPNASGWLESTIDEWILSRATPQTPPPQ